MRADVSRQRAEPGPVDWTPSKTQSRAVREYLELLDQEAEFKRPQKSVSLTDPNSQWSSAKGPAEFYYSTNYMVDVGKNIIMDVEASVSTLSSEVATTRTMIERIEENYAICPERLMGDTAYGAAENLGYLVEEKKIAPHVPVWDKSKRKDGTYSNSEFEWDEDADKYICPGDKELRRSRYKPRALSTGITKDNRIIYRASTKDCKDCLFKDRCCPKTSHREIARSIYEKSREVAREICESDAYVKSSRERKKVEMLFAHMKRNLGFRRLRLRGIKSANDEFLLVATVQNLRRMAKLLSQPPPEHGVVTSAIQPMA